MNDDDMEVEPNPTLGEQVAYLTDVIRVLTKRLDEHGIEIRKLKHELKTKASATPFGARGW